MNLKYQYSEYAHKTIEAANDNEAYHLVWKRKLISILVVRIISHMAFFLLKFGPLHDIFVLIAYARIPHCIAHAGVSSYARNLMFGLTLHLHPYFRNEISEGSGESAHMRRLARPSLIDNAISTSIVIAGSY